MCSDASGSRTASDLFGHESAFNLDTPTYSAADGQLIPNPTSVERGACRAAWLATRVESFSFGTDIADCAKTSKLLNEALHPSVQ